MTVTDTTTPRCPKCLSGNTMVGAAGVGRCFDCTHEWDPATEVAPEPLAVEPFAMAPIEDVYGPDDAVTDWDGIHDPDALIGGTARLEGGQVATVNAFPDADHVHVTLNDGRDEIVPMSDVERITPRASAAVVEAADDAHDAVGNVIDVPDLSVVSPAVETLDDYDDQVQMTVTLAQLIVMAGVSSVEGSGADVYPVAPPQGFLPDDPALMPVIEQAAAMAVGMLIVNLHLDVDAIVHTLQGPQPEEVGDQQQETEA